MADEGVDQLVQAVKQLLDQLNESRREMTRAMMLCPALIEVQKPDDLSMLLSLAIDDRNWAAVRFLIDTANADLPDEWRLTAAIHLDQLEKTRILIILGARLTAAGDCLDRANWRKHFRLLIAHGACIPSAPWMLQFKEQVRCGRRVALTMIGIRRFKGAVRHVDRFLIREIALAIVVAVIHHN